jgi:hypothetical protein
VPLQRPASTRLFSWIGALLFFVSLAYFLFSYVATFGVITVGTDGWSAVVWNVTIFTIFALHHSLFARRPVRAWVARIVPADLERSFYVWIASILFIVVCASWRPVAGVAWEVPGPAVWVVRTLQALGIVLTLKSAGMLDVRELAGITTVSAATEFKVAGPYGWVRHPIYAGWFLMVFAASPMTLTRLVFAVVSCAYLLVAIPFEERTIRAASNGGYDRYMRRVPWRLIPRIY